MINISLLPLKTLKWSVHDTCMARFFVVQTVPHRAAIGENRFDKSSIQQYTCIYTDIRPKCTYTRGNSSCNLFDMFGPWKILRTLQSRRLLQGLIKQREIEFSRSYGYGLLSLVEVFRLVNTSLHQVYWDIYCDFCKFVISSSWVYEGSVQLHEIHVGWIVSVLF